MSDASAAELPELQTRVGVALWDDHRFCGWSVRDDLAGQDGFWSVISLAIGGERLDRAQAELLDDLATASVSADPRIWPLKICRLLTAYGRYEPGFGGTFLAMAGSAVGPAAIARTARFLFDLATELGEGVADEPALRQAWRSRVDEGGPLPGFGTPYRSEDERLGPITAAVERHGGGTGRFWRLVQQSAPIVGEAKGLAINAGAALSAACLDLGFTPPQVAALAILLLAPNIVANAYEGAEEAPAVLRSLPEAFVRYVGPAPRRSPRFQEGG